MVFPNIFDFLDSRFSAVELIVLWVYLYSVDYRWLKVEMLTTIPVVRYNKILFNLLPCAAISSNIWSSIRWALPGKLAMPLFDTSNLNNEQTYWNLLRSRTEDRKSKRWTASPRPLKPAISLVHLIVIWQWGGISVSGSLSSCPDDFCLYFRHTRWFDKKKTNENTYVASKIIWIKTNSIYLLIIKMVIL